jgi:V/A-type H+-transporting ATPase subunit E
MTDQVQHLIDRIRRDGVAAVEQQCKDLLTQARSQADAIVAQARKTAETLEQDAEHRAAELVERGIRNLQQASRDLLLQVGERLEQMVRDLLAQATDQAMRGEVVEQMLLRLAEGFATNGAIEGQIDIIVGEADKERLMRFIMGQVRDKLEQGVTVVVDPRVRRGFKLSHAGGTIHHDFTGEAVAAALATLLRPQLAEIVMQAALPAARADGS